MAKQFVNADGSVDYEASGAQKKWGGQFSTLSEALGKMVDFYKYNDSGKHEARERLRYLNGADEAPADRVPTTAPRERDQDRERGGTSSGSGVSAGATYVSNITVDGRQRSVRYADRGSQLAGDALIRELAQAKGVSQ